MKSTTLGAGIGYRRGMVFDFRHKNREGHWKSSGHRKGVDRDAAFASLEEKFGPMPAGRYKLYGDVVHRSGLPETVVADLVLPADITGTPLAGDDAGGEEHVRIGA